MKKVMIVVFSAMIAITLSAPVWAQTTTPTPADHGKPGTSVSKTNKKNAKAKAKATKRKNRKAANANGTNGTNGTNSTK